MAVEVVFEIPREIAYNATIRRHLWNVGYFVRDLWLARSPYAGGGYARGLTLAGSVSVKGNKIHVSNFCKHAQYVEYGHRSFNIGLAMLKNGRNVKVSKDGNRYKRVKIDRSPTSRYRRESVASSVKQKFQRLAPLGMRLPRIDRYGQAPVYPQRKSLMKPIKPGAPRKGPEGIFTVSERAIKEDPSRWLVPALAGRYLARQVQEEARPFVVQTMRDMVQGERARQQRLTGKEPRWYKQKTARGAIRTGPVRRI